jgi:hypothetical protein
MLIYRYGQIVNILDGLQGHWERKIKTSVIMLSSASSSSSRAQQVGVCDRACSGCDSSWRVWAVLWASGTTPELYFRTLEGCIVGRRQQPPGAA